VTFQRKKGVVIGVGEKENKKAFFQKMFPDEEFFKTDLDTHTIYFNPTHKIVLSNYFNNRNGIKLECLKDLYKFLNSRKYI